MSDRSGTINLDDFNFNQIDNLTPEDFEEFVMSCLDRAGWKKLHRTQVGIDSRYGDGGYDIEGLRNDRKWLFEVKKRTDSTVGVEALAQIIRAGQLKHITNLALVTNSTFTAKVEDEAGLLGIELIDRNRLQNIFLEGKTDVGRRYKLRKYQEDIITDVLARWRNKGQTQFLIQMATGLGKTVTCAGLVKELIHITLASKRIPRVLFVSHQKEILKQSARTFKATFGFNYTYTTLYDGAQLNWEKTEGGFFFSTFQTLLLQSPPIPPDTFDIVIVDEAHHFPANTFSKLASILKPHFTIGLTATPDRLDNRSTLSYFGGVAGLVGGRDLAWGIKNGYLAFPKYRLLTDDIDEFKLGSIRTGLTLSEIDDIVFLKKRDEEIVSILINHLNQSNVELPKTIVFCKSIRHIENLLTYFPPGSATIAHSKLDRNTVAENIKLFREGRFRFILTVDLFNEGIDIPEVNVLVFLRATASKTVWYQQLGRGLRKTEKKNFVDIFDFVGSIARILDVKELTDQVGSKIIQRNSDESVVNEVIYDESLTVTYSQAAAEVLRLIQQLEYKADNKAACIAAVKNIFDNLGHVPSAEELETHLTSVSLDQLTTLFGSYISVITAAFPVENLTALHDEVKARIRNTYNSLVAQNGIKPSAQLLELSARIGDLPLADSQYISEFLLSTPVLNLSSINSAHGTNETTQGAQITRSALIDKYRSRLRSRKDLLSLTAEERREIRSVFPLESDILYAIQSIKSPHSKKRISK